MFPSRLSSLFLKNFQTFSKFGPSSSIQTKNALNLIKYDLNIRKISNIPSKTPSFFNQKSNNQENVFQFFKKREFHGTNGQKQRSNWYEGRNNQSRGYTLGPKQLIYGLIGINTLVFASWQYSIQNYKQFNDSSLYKAMMKNFTVSWDNVVNGKRWWTVLTCGFSHSDFMHFGINMFVLYSFGSAIAQGMGTRRFLTFYLGSIIFSSLFTLIYHHYIVPRFSNDRMRKMTALMSSSQGASGAITAMTVLYAVLFPHNQVLIFGIVPMPAWAAIGGFVAYDVYRSYQMSGGRVDSAGHVGGALYGVLYYLTQIRR